MSPVPPPVVEVQSTGRTTPCCNSGRDTPGFTVGGRCWCAVGLVLRLCRCWSNLKVVVRRVAIFALSTMMNLPFMLFPQDDLLGAMDICLLLSSIRPWTGIP